VRRALDAHPPDPTAHAAPPPTHTHARAHTQEGHAPARAAAPAARAAHPSAPPAGTRRRALPPPRRRARPPPSGACAHWCVCRSASRGALRVLGQGLVAPAGRAPQGMTCTQSHTPAATTTTTHAVLPAQRPHTSHAPERLLLPPRGQRLARELRHDRLAPRRLPRLLLGAGAWCAVSPRACIACVCVCVLRVCVCVACVCVCCVCVCVCARRAQRV
jgi:hypothetical protein